MYGYIYKFTIIETAEFYVGKHKWPKSSLDESYWGSGKLWRNKIKKYPKDEWQNFIHREILDTAETEDELNAKEIYWIAKLNAMIDGLNLTQGGANPILFGEANPAYGTHLSAEAKQRISDGSHLWHQLHEGEAYRKLREWQLNNPVAYSIAQTRHLYGNKNGMYGKGYLLKGKVFSDEHKKRLSENHADVSGSNNPFFGKHHTDDVIAKLKAASGKPIFIYSIDNALIAEFISIKDAAKWLEVDRRIIDRRYDKNESYFSRKLNKEIIFWSYCLQN